jgi:nucleoside-diphosphate kinase
MEKTLVFLKPDAISRGLIGDITTRFERKGLKLVGCKMKKIDKPVLEEHYSHLSDEPFYDRIVKYMRSLPVVIQCWEGVDAVSVVRKIAGSTNGRGAKPGTIRGDYSMSIQNNVVHASENEEVAAEEVERFFHSSELYSYEHPLKGFIYSIDEA